MCVAYLGRLSEDGKVGLVAFGTPLENSDKVRVEVSVHLLPVHLQNDVPLTQLGTPWVVHDLFHHRAHGRLTCGREMRASLRRLSHVLYIVQWNLPSTHQCEGTTFMRQPRQIHWKKECMNSWKVAIELDMNLNTTTPQS